MDEIYKKLAASVDQSALTFDNGAATFDVYEVWQKDGTDLVKPIPSKIPCGSVDNWLKNGPARLSDHTLLLRLVLVSIVEAGPTVAGAKSRVVQIPEAANAKIVGAFKLKLASAYIKSSVASVTAFPKVALGEDKELCTYAFNHAPKLAAVWSQERHTGEEAREKQGPTAGIVYIAEESSKKDGTKAQKNAKAQPDITPKMMLTRLCSSPWQAELYSGNMVPALLLAMQLGFEVDLTQNAISKGIRDVEGRTGYHRFKNRQSDTNQHELGQLAVDASGFASKLASAERKSASAKKLLDFILSESGKDSLLDLGERNKTAQQLLQHYIGVLKERLEMQALDTRFTMSRIDIQINAIFNLITQEDSLNSIKLAISTHQISHASYRDSSSMRTLAVVTMFFLPGSFVSALFSIPMFDWDKVVPGSSSIGIGLLPQFGLYWAITLPLTIATFCFYFLWLWHLKRERDAQFKETLGKPAENSGGEEGEMMSFIEERRLARKRRETLP